IRETSAGEKRLPLTPQSVTKLVKLGATVAVETGFGTPLGLSDADFTASGAELGGRRELLSAADLLLSVQPPDLDDIAVLRHGAMTAGFLDPFFRPEVVAALAERGID